jgi:hypothetical protein
MVRGHHKGASDTASATASATGRRPLTPFYMPPWRDKIGEGELNDLVEYPDEPHAQRRKNRVLARGAGRHVRWLRCEESLCRVVALFAEGEVALTGSINFLEWLNIAMASVVEVWL